MWQRQVPTARRFADDVSARGGTVEWLDLPQKGLSGNSHMIMMDTNSDQVADLIQDWIRRHDLMT